MLKITFKRALKNKRIWIAFGIGLIVSMLGLYYGVKNSIGWLNDISYIDEYHVFPPGLFNTWLFGLMVYWPSNVYVYLFPLIAVIAFGRTVFDDKKSGYIKNMVLKVGKKKYYTSMYLTTFIIGGAVVVVPLILNILGTMLFVPVLPVEPSTVFYAQRNTTLFGVIFYSHPFVYTAIYLIIDFIYAGLFACLGILLVDICDYGYMIDIGPFFIVLFINSLMSIIGLEDHSPYRFLTGSEFRIYGISVFGEMLLLILIVGIHYLWKIKKDEI